MFRFEMFATSLSEGLLTNIVATLLGNSLAMIANDAVRKAALPIASTIRMTKLSVMNGMWPSTLSSKLSCYKNKLKRMKFHSLYIVLEPILV